VNTNGSYAVNFTAPNLSTQRIGVVSSLANVKVDLPLAYPAPALSGSSSPSVNQGNSYVSTGVPAATGYELESARLQTFAGEGAENGLAAVATNASGTYPVRSTDLTASGSYAFHLAHPTQVSQSVTLNSALLLGTNCQLSFAKLLGLASVAQTARAQISTNDGASWFNVWSQAGNNTWGESSFTTVNVSLSAYDGRVIRLRFTYEATGPHYSNTDSGAGFYFDDIAISGARELLSPITNVFAGTTLSFTPANSGAWSLRSRALVGTRRLPWGPLLQVTAVAPAPVVRWVTQPVLSAGSVQAEFEVTGYVSGLTFQLWKATSPTGGWSQDTGATLTVLVPNARYRFTTSTGAAGAQFYRVKASW
jgi:hypothetical protein